MTSISKYCDVFPKGMHVFVLKNDKTVNKKRIYFLFPSLKTINKFSGESQLIADHYTFLIEGNKADKRPVKSHLTIYNPADIVFNKNFNGFVSRILFKLPNEFLIENIDKHIKLDIQAYSECAKEIILTPLQKNVGGGLPLRISKKLNKKTFATKHIATMLKKFYITEMTIIGIKNDDGKYHYTAFVTTQVPDDVGNSESEDSEDVLPIARSFTFSLVEHSVYKMEKKLVGIMNKWEDVYLHHCV
jgi:hypothetical protein